MGMVLPGDGTPLVVGPHIVVVLLFGVSCTGNLVSIGHVAGDIYIGGLPLDCFLLDIGYYLGSLHSNSPCSEGVHGMVVYLHCIMVPPIIILIIKGFLVGIWRSLHIETVVDPYFVVECLSGFDYAVEEPWEF